MIKMCTALTAQNRTECKRPVAESAQISLCALHLLMAKTEADTIGVKALAATVRAEGI